MKPPAIVPTRDGLKMYDYINGEPVDVTPAWAATFTISRDRRVVCRVCQLIGVTDLEAHARDH